MPQDGIYHFLTAEDLARLGRVSIGSRFTVEGAAAGAHRSNLKGVSVEFADYRQYVPGDDPKHLDWRVFGRNERLYLREYEEETSLRVHLLVDSSRSMAYASKDTSKFQYASTLATAIAYITIHHQDTAGLAIFDSRCRQILPPRNGPEHLRTLANTLANTTPDAKTDLAATLHLIAEQTRKRGLVVILSDLFDDINKIKAALAHFRRRKHDVVVYQILDQAEIDFPFRESTAFEDLETTDKITTNPREIREAYQQTIGTFLLHCKQTCASLGIDHQLLSTNKNPIDALLQHLKQRALVGR